MPRMPRRLSFAAALGLPCLAQGAFGDQPLFEADDTLRVTIRAPLEAIADERDSGEYHEGTLSFIDAGGQKRVLDLKLRARGKYRRRASTCRFPPIRLNFRKSQVAGTLFAGQDKLKLVTHCRTGSERYEQMLLKEYLAYRFLETLTPSSFQSRLMRVTWHDPAEGEAPFEHYAFVIEDEELLGFRIGLPPAEIKGTRPQRLNARQAALVSVFEYLIGNTDFSLIAGPADDDCCHNVVLYGVGDDDLVPIPYDFDFSGLVDAPYAEPNPRLRIRSVRTRLYRGRCEHNGELEAVIRAFRDNREVLLALVGSQEGMTDHSRRSTRRYVEDFYEDLETPRDIDRRLVRRCIQPARAAPASRRRSARRAGGPGSRARSAGPTGRNAQRGCRPGSPGSR